VGVPLYWGTILKYHYSVYYFAQEVGKNWFALGGYAVLVCRPFSSTKKRTVSVRGFNGSVEGQACARKGAVTRRKFVNGWKGGCGASLRKLMGVGASRAFQGGRGERPGLWSRSFTFLSV